MRSIVYLRDLIYFPINTYIIFVFILYHYISRNILYRKHTFHFVSFTVTQLKCKGCGSIKMFDGADQNVLHMNKFIISHSVLRDYMKQYLTIG